MAHTGEFAIPPEPYPARPRWSGDFHRLEASLFSERDAAERRADDFADAFVPGRSQKRRSVTHSITDRYLLPQLPDIPSLRIDLADLDDIP